jgi:peptidoglycan/xylan/chitin deacetylase (PgdA/CDA1 family)
MLANPIPWPNGCRCAVAVSFDMDADSILHLAHPDSADNRVMALSMLRYGPEVAIPRILAMYRRFGMKQTFFIPAWSMERYPAAVEAILTDGHEIGHHGYLHEHPNELSREDELYWMQRSIEVITSMTGQRPRGHRAPSYRFSRNSLDHLVSEGFHYDASLMGDDIPYLLDNGSGSVIEMPSHYAMDDWAHYMSSRDLAYVMQPKATSDAMKAFREEFDSVWRHGGMWLAVWHPFLSGRMARCDAIEELLTYMHEKGGVWFARLEDIAAHVRALEASGQWRPRCDNLPYYVSPIQELKRP